MCIVQPAGVVPRRQGAEEIKRKVARLAQALHLKGVLRNAAKDYLVGWARGTRPLEPRPPKYAFLEHSQDAELPRRVPAVPLRAPPMAQLVQVDMRRAAGRPLPRDLPDLAMVLRPDAGA